MAAELDLDAAVRPGGADPHPVAEDPAANGHGVGCRQGTGVIGRPALFDLVGDEAPGLGQVEAVGTHDRLPRGIHRRHAVDAERAKAGLGVGDQVPGRALGGQTQRVHDARALLLTASDVAKRDPLSVHDGPLHGVEERWRGAGMGHPVPAGRVDDDCRRRRLGS